MARGSLPRYVVNFQELESLFPLEADSLFNPDKARQRCKGLYINALEDKTYTETWVLEKDIVLTGIKIACSREHEWFMDNFDIVINFSGEEKEVFSSVYMKDFMEYKHFVCYLEVLAGSEITIRYKNQSGTEKDIWFDIDYVSEK